MDQIERHDDPTMIDCDWFFIRDAFSARCRPTRLSSTFRTALRGGLGPASCRSAPSRSSTTATASGRSKNVPAITHGPRAGGQHTVNEWVEIDDLVRVALLYAATAVAYCRLSQMTTP